MTASRIMKQLGRETGTRRSLGSIVCLLAMLVLLGGHWNVLQSIAWGRMIISFSKHESLSNAISKTFDGRHLCSACIAIRAGKAEEQKHSNGIPLVKVESLPEFSVECDLASIPLRSNLVLEQQWHPCGGYCSRTDTPPRPPPRTVLRWGIDRLLA